MNDRRIKILAPIDRIREIIPLIKAGADEFYCGVITGKRNLGSIRATGIKKSNLANLKELKKLVESLHKKKKRVFLTLNTPHDSPEILKTIGENIEEIKSIGLDGIIVGNINLMDKLENCGLEIIASSLLETKNKETARLLIDEFGVKRIILDRQITIDDIKEIASSFPQTEFEAFAMATACRSLNSACRWYLPNKKNLRHIHTCRHPISIKNANNLSLSDKRIITGRIRMPSICCGACALYQFKQNNLFSVKIVGRGHRLSTKIRHVKFIKQVIDILEKDYSKKVFYRKTQNLFKKTFGRECQEQYCYYPHFFNE